MYARSALRVQTIARRGFSSTRPRLAYHYPEGPRSNLPFNPLKKNFFWTYWTFMGVGFGAPFLIAVWQTKKSK